MKRRHAVPIISALVLVLAMALPVQAVEPTSVAIIQCNDNGGGSQNVPARSFVTFSYGWAAMTQRQVNQFLNRSTVRFTVRGTAIANPNSYWGTPMQMDEGGIWTVPWRYPFGRLGSGNTAKTTMQVTLRRPVFDGIYHVPAGPIHIPPLKCTIY